MNHNLSWSQLFDLYIRSRAAATSALIEDPSELGQDDEWLFKEVYEYVNKLSAGQFIDLIKEAIEKAREKYKDHPDGGFVVFEIVSEVIWLRPTRFYYTSYPDPNEVPLDLNGQEEAKIIDIIIDLRKNLPVPHKYRADILIKEMIGKFPEQLKYQCKCGYYKSEKRFGICPLCNRKQN